MTKILQDEVERATVIAYEQLIEMEAYTKSYSNACDPLLTKIVEAGFSNFRDAIVACLYAYHCTKTEVVDEKEKIADNWRICRMQGNSGLRFYTEGSMEPTEASIQATLSPPNFGKIELGTFSSEWLICGLQCSEGNWHYKGPKGIDLQTGDLIESVESDWENGKTVVTWFTDGRFRITASAVIEGNLSSRRDSAILKSLERVLKKNNQPFPRQLTHLNYGIEITSSRGINVVVEDLL